MCAGNLNWIIVSGAYLWCFPPHLSVSLVGTALLSWLHKRFYVDGTTSIGLQSEFDFCVLNCSVKEQSKKSVIYLLAAEIQTEHGTYMMTNMKLVLQNSALHFHTSPSVYLKSNKLHIGAFYTITVEWNLKLGTGKTVWWTLEDVQLFYHTPVFYIPSHFCSAKASAQSHIRTWRFLEMDLSWKIACLVLSPNSFIWMEWSAGAYLN